LNKGNFISGEELSDKLGITRAAVWKHIMKLKQQGYKIDGRSGKGYRLDDYSDSYDREAIISRLQTKIIGQELIFLDETDSTNNELKRLAANGLKEGTVVIADKQVAGRGRRGRTWESEAGKGIYMSILLRPDIPPEKVQAITLAASSAVCMAIQSYTGIKPGIKWPNDVLIGNKKVCGILTEMSGEPDKVYSVIVGIGVNVYQKDTDFSKDLRATAASLMPHSPAKITRSILVARILEAFEGLYIDFAKKHSTKGFLDIWRSFSITIGCDIIVYQNDKAWQGKALDVLDDGRLLVELGNGRCQAISSGEISIRKI
jgi:BirA family biotin operon repressor/biotin-[acetyl-CoA-carboxylase] ligase